MSTLTDLVRSLIDRGGESQNLDFKGPMRWPPNNHTKWGLVQDLLAFSNTKDGGHIVVGIKDGTNEVVGLSSADAATWDPSDIYEAVKAHSSPVPSFSVQVADMPTSGRLVLISITEFASLPHFCCAEVVVGKQEILRKGGIYIRTPGAQSKLMSDVEEGQELFDRALHKHPEYLALLDQLQEQRVVTSDYYSTQIQEDLKGSTG